MAETAAKTGINAKTVAAWERKARLGPQDVASGGLAVDVQSLMPRPQFYQDLKPEIKAAWRDFPTFRERYMNRRLVEWQVVAAKQVVKWLASDQTEYIVFNCPPGSGKTTFWTDLMCWLIVRDRNIRILFGSRTAKLAEMPVNRVRTMLTRTRPLPDAKGCIVKDFGRFKPELNDIWRRNAFTVLTLDSQPVEDKEPTLTAYGMESEFLGHRGDLVLWDDLVVGSTLKTIDQVEAQRKWWEEEGSTRVEPGGALVLNGQRMGPSDLYRYALDQKLGDTERSRFQHVVYPAHFDDKCQGDHGPDLEEDVNGDLIYDKRVPPAKAWPDGCLLDPIRLPWFGPGGLVTIRRNRADKYRVQYQQEETDPDTVLVQPIWVSGGRDRSGEEFPGCWDNHRGLLEVPKGLSEPVFSICTADPSPTKYWSVQWWLYHPASEQRFLMNLLRTPMSAHDFLDWNENSKEFFGVMEDWQQASRELHFPISHWIVERNGAQQFLLAYDHVHRWVRQNRVQIIAHQTGLNKLNPEYGIQSIANRYRFGNVRLPGKTFGADGLPDRGRSVALKLVEEATRYPDSATDDCLMAQWFLEYHIPSLARVRAPKKAAPRPKWMRRSVMA